MKKTPIFEEVFTRTLSLPGFWSKALVGGLLSFLPGLNLFAFGYLLRFTLSLRKSGRLALPEWTDWKGLFIDGLKFAVVWVAYWLLPVLLSLGLSTFIGGIGLGAISFLLFSLVFLFSPVLLGAALYRYNTHSNFKALLDVALIVRMSYAWFPRMIVPSLAFVGFFAVAWPLYGFALFVGFILILAHTSLIFRAMEQSRAQSPSKQSEMLRMPPPKRKQPATVDTESGVFKLILR